MILLSLAQHNKKWGYKTVKKLILAGIMILTITGASMASEHVLVDNVPSSIPKIELEKAIVTALGNRKWNVVSTDDEKIQAELNHRGYECSIAIKNVNEVLILNDTCLYKTEEYKQPPQIVKSEIPGRWLRNLVKDMQNTVNGLSLIYK